MMCLRYSRACSQHAHNTHQAPTNDLRQHTITTACQHNHARVKRTSVAPLVCATAHSIFQPQSKRSAVQRWAANATFSRVNVSAGARALFTRTHTRELIARDDELYNLVSVWCEHRFSDARSFISVRSFECVFVLC